LDNGAAVVVSKRSKTHGGDGDGGAAAWQVRGKASESERAKNGLSNDVASHFTPFLPDWSGQRWCTAAMWRECPMAGQPLTVRHSRPSALMK